MPFLNCILRVQSFDDPAASSAPVLRTVDRNVQVQGGVVQTPVAVPLSLAPGETVTVFDGSRTIGADGTTELAISISPLSPDRYRLTWTGNGTNPGFKVERGFNANGSSLTLTLNANLTVTVTGTGPTYTAAQVGDQVLIPGVATGDTGNPFDARNAGYWTVIGRSNTSLTLARAAGWSGGVTETVAVTSNNQFIVFGSDRAQAGDQLELLAGFSTNALRVYPLLAVSPRWVDIQSTVPLAPETAVPGTNGLAVYAAAKRAIYVEVDQLASVRLNGASVDTDMVEPVFDTTLGERKGMSFKTGPAWKMVVVNRSSVRLSGLACGWG